MPDDVRLPGRAFLLLIASEGIEITYNFIAYCNIHYLLIAPEGIEIFNINGKRTLMFALNRTRRN